MIIRIEQADPRVRITVHLIVFGRIILLQVGKQDVIVLKAVHDIAQSVIGEIVDPAQQLLNIHVYADFHARMICRRILAQARQGNGGGKLLRSGRRIDRFGDHFQRHRQPEKDHGHQRGNTSLHRLLPPCSVPHNALYLPVFFIRSEYIIPDGFSYFNCIPEITDIHE